MSDHDHNPEPVVLELAPMPREQEGPFLLLGVDKAAADEQIEAHWAQRVILARRRQLAVPLEDVNWAREVLRDPDKRLRADLASLNADTSDRLLAGLIDRYGAPTWPPQDAEKPWADYTPAVDVPDIRAVHDTLAVPEVPLEVPAVAQLLGKFLQEPLDPWALPE